MSDSFQSPDSMSSPAFTRGWLEKLASVFACAFFGCLLQVSSLGARIDLALLDTTTNVLREYFPVAVSNEVVVVGIDEASAARYPEPLTLWHRYVGEFLRAAAAGKATAVGLDLVLPDHSYNEVLPGSDEALMMGILAAKKEIPVVLALTVEASGKQRGLFRKFQLVAGEDGTGLALFPRDADHVVRRFDERIGENASVVPTMVGQLSRQLGKDPEPGIIDFSRGAPFTYIPIHEVLATLQAGDDVRLGQMFAGRPVLLGSVLPSSDAILQPVNLASWEDNGNLAPGVLIHAQALRSILNHGLIKDVPLWLVAALILSVSTGWLAGLRPVLAGGVLAVMLGGAFVGSAWLFRRGWYLPLSGVYAAICIGLIGPLARDALNKLKERLFLKRSFSGSVSPVVMHEILSGKLSPGLGGERKYVCVLFADIRGFTTLSESLPPEAVITLLNRYFDRVVDQIHHQEGAVVCFMGDGIMAIFGAPKRLHNPCESALLAAKGMQREVVKLNEALVQEGAAPIQIGVGLHAGDAVIGQVGSSGRHDYTAIGDVTNVASRLEGLTKDVGFEIVCSKDVVDALESNSDLISVGPQSIKGHTPVHAYGWRPR
ncbi:MAG: CHASE2 domain-containing protein [Rhodocyclales bacterium]|nr:CHASE2 domain-containing protein [Rhodocyclales bacterium]